MRSLHKSVFMTAVLSHNMDYDLVDSVLLARETVLVWLMHCDFQFVFEGHYSPDY
jgi:hypothetical protein